MSSWQVQRGQSVYRVTVKERVMESKNVEMWISKYALTTGIKSALMRRVSDGYAHPAGDVFTSWACFSVGKEAHHTKNDAIAAAETMRARKIASLKKQLARLESLRFE